MSNVNKQFEKWWETERLSTAFDSFREVAKEAFQAGHAASGRDELLWALREIEIAFYDSAAHGALACKMAAIATDALKKARGES